MRGHAKPQPDAGRAPDETGWIAGLDSFGPHGALRASRLARTPLETDREARFALSGLTGALGGVYVVAGFTLPANLRDLTVALIAIGLVQAAWGTAAYRGSRIALGVGAVGNLMLATVWVLSRTVGLPFGAGAIQPVGILDALCAADSLVIVVVACGALMRAGAATRLRFPTAPLSQFAILMAVLTISALLGGHTHTPQAREVPGQAGPHLHFYCRLL